MDEGNRLLDAWQWLGPAGRETAEGVLLVRETSVNQLLAGLEAGKMQPAELSAGVRQRLLMHKSASVQERATKLFQDVDTHDRARVVNEFKAALSIKGDLRKGRDHFIARCAACHQLGDLGRVVGPDLKTITNRSREDLLVALLDPSRSVEPRYLGYTALLQGGESVYGMIVAETANSIVMTLMDGSERVIARTELKAITSSGKSAMPAGLEAGLGHADVADLLAFIQQQLSLR
jgi:putative heme-binding domain-containing protein